MSLLDKLAEMGKSAVTTDLQLKQLRDELDKMSLKVDTLGESLQQIGNRVTRLETQRESDLARLQIEVERAEMRLSRQLPPSN